MKFTINKDEFLKGLLQVGKIIPTKAIYPTLTNVKIELNDAGLVLTGSDGQISIQSTIPFFIDDKEIIRDVEKGSILVDNHIITEIVRRVDGKEISFVALEDSIVEIDNEKSSFKLNSIRGEEYQDIDFDENGVKVTVSAKQLLEAVNQVSFAACIKSTRQVLTAINMTSDSSHISFVATDSARLAEKDIEASTTERFSANIPAKSFIELTKSITNEEDVVMFISDKKALFQLNHTLMTTTLTGGDYPNTKNIIPKSFQYTLEVNAFEFLNAMDRVAILSGEKQNVVKISMTENKVVVSCRSSQLGSAEESIKLFKYNGDSLEISVNNEFVSSAIKALNCEDVSLNFNGAMKSFTISNKNDPNIIQLLTPIRTY
ncbi:MAG: DNA polymerase III subunit beta [Erysipelotrichaceae bacterium]|jgi:DNA polymerase-3 subunit beta|nr:DNA polymerase III subunit beta [Erysipelotrichaceae bacterium]MCB9499885.1 DNA polymerase III subunit beta [Erysipelotrichaceae bacterium]